MRATASFSTSFLSTTFTIGIEAGLAPRRTRLAILPASKPLLYQPMPIAASAPLSTNSGSLMIIGSRWSAATFAIPEKAWRAVLSPVIQSAWMSLVASTWAPWKTSEVLVIAISSSFRPRAAHASRPTDIALREFASELLYRVPT